MKLLFLVAFVATTVIEQVTPLGQQCYQCITRHPSWNIENCKTAPVTCALGNFCTKAQFGGSLTIRGCAPGGTEKSFVEGGGTVRESRMCKKTREYFTSNHVSAALKTEFQTHLKVFEASCPKGNALLNKLKKTEPKKAFTCKKKLCNGSTHIDAAAVSVFVAAAATIFASKQWL